MSQANYKNFPSRFLAGRRTRGVTLIMVAGVLVILAAMGAGFYSLSVSQVKSATRYTDTTRAIMMAQAGVVDATARLKAGIFERPESPSENWYTVDYMNGARRSISFPSQDLKAAASKNPYRSYTRALTNSVATDSDRYILSVTDAQSKINVNACDNLGILLDNLCRVVGPPLVAADQDYLQPRRWAQEGAAGFGTNPKDSIGNREIYYSVDAQGKPTDLRPDGTARFGDGFAIAGYRSRLKSGRFGTLEEVKAALTVKTNTAHPELEELERVVKFEAIRQYITVDSWVDITTVCTGKFEWAKDKFAIDRDKSWVADDLANDPLNHRGSLRGCYISIINGHGQGQTRRIKTNGIDWIELETGFTVDPGPISSYMIMAKVDANVDPLDYKSAVAADGLAFKPLGTLQDNPDIDYQRYPLCIHRAPVNVNTASDKVLEAVFMGINVQHGHPMAVGTNATADKIRNTWKMNDPKLLESKLVTLVGAKRIPQDTGKLVLDCSLSDLTKESSFDYISNFGTLGTSGNFEYNGGNINEAHELAYRVLMARQRKLDTATGKPLDVKTKRDPDETTADLDTDFAGYERGPIRSYDDLYFRVVKPWDDVRSYGVLADYGRKTIPFSGKTPVTKSKLKISVAKMVMAQVNPNTDILKFNPNIEWIDRWGRNFTEMEPLMVYNGAVPRYVDTGSCMVNNDLRSKKGIKGAYYIRSQRYKSDEMIDKTDLNRATTELCFFSNGVFDIDSKGQVVKNDEAVAERRLLATVKVYDIWRETTQLQFTQGRFEAPGGIGKAGTNSAGRITRDAYNTTERMPLTTLPEPLVPLKYKLNPKFGSIKDIIDTAAPNGRDVRGNIKEPLQPDSIANRVFPAIYDGQIVLATNTMSAETAGESCTFLASFNGDLDTDTCKGNGRELAKTPVDKTVRVVDTVGLLGVLDDTQIDYDPRENDANAKKKIPAADWNIFTTDDPTGALFGPRNELNYWENVACRAGDLRPDGVWLGYPGASGKEATLKYTYDKNYFIGPLNGGDANKGAGVTIFMWFKSNWTNTDNREHEFLSASRAGPINQRGIHSLKKMGYFSETGKDRLANSYRVGENDLAHNTDLKAINGDSYRPDYNIYLHGGFKTYKTPLTSVRESPSYHVQPFRWGSVGALYDWSRNSQVDGSTEFIGHLMDRDNNNRPPATLKYLMDLYASLHRAFIDSQRDPGGRYFSSQYYWKDANNNNAKAYGVDIGQKNGVNYGSVCQQAGWQWQDGVSDEPIFSINNVNMNRINNNIRVQPIDGTCAVIDQLKLCATTWIEKQIESAQTTCRYYTPDYPSERLKCPLFTSQSMLKSLRGSEANKGTSDQKIQVIRVTWTAFNPRFLYENKDMSTKRQEFVKQSPLSIRIKGPFDYVQYNMDVERNLEAAEKLKNEGSMGINDPNMIRAVSVPAQGCERPSPVDYTRYGTKYPQASTGVEVELLQAENANLASPVINGKTWEWPEEENVYDDPAKPAIVLASELHYRVRFRYRVDPLINAAANIRNSVDHVDPTKQYVLDTPVFDDITVLYTTPGLQILKYKEETE